MEEEAASPPPPCVSVVPSAESLSVLWGSVEHGGKTKNLKS